MSKEKGTEITINVSNIISGLAFGVGVGVAAGVAYYFLNGSKSSQNTGKRNKVDLDDDDADCKTMDLQPRKKELEEREH